MTTQQKPRLKSTVKAGIAGFAAALILSAVIGFGGCFAFSNAESTTKITSTQLKSSLEQASDLITTKYYYSEIGKFDNSYEINGWSIPFTGKSFILTYQGEAQLGFQTSDLQVRVRGNTIEVSCPPITILSNSIPSESVEVYDQSFNIFNPVTVDDYLKFETEQKKRAEAKMAENGTYERAQQDAEKAITQLLNMIPQVQESYTIKVSFREQEPSADDSSLAGSSSSSSASSALSAADDNDRSSASSASSDSASSRSSN